MEVFSFVAVVLLAFVLMLFLTGGIQFSWQRDPHRKVKAAAGVPTDDDGVLPAARPSNPEMAEWYDEALHELDEYDPEAFELLQYLHAPEPEPTRRTVIGKLNEPVAVLNIPNRLDDETVARMLDIWNEVKTNGAPRPAVLGDGMTLSYLNGRSRSADRQPCAHCGLSFVAHPVGEGHVWQARGSADFVEHCHCQSCEDYRMKVIDSITDEVMQVSDFAGNTYSVPTKPTRAQRAQAELDKARADYEREERRLQELLAKRQTGTASSGPR